MPVKKAAIKDLKQSKKRAARNQDKKRTFKYLIKKVLKAVDAGDKKQAQETYQKAQKAIDKAAKVNVIKKNNAARKKARLTKKINAIS